MSSSRIYAGGVVAVLGWLTALPVWGQRIQFPTQVRGQLVQAPVGGSTYAPAPTTTPTFTTPAPAFTTPAPVYSAPPASTYAPAPAPSYSAPPATFQGTVTPAPAWDPYVDPSQMPGGTPYYQPPQGAAAQPPALFPGSGGPSVFQPGGYAYNRADGTVGAWPRLFQEIRGEYTWLANIGDEEDELGINSVAASATMAFPFFYDQAPLLITPGGAIHWFNGPESTAPGSPDLPPRVYDLYLDTAWKPVITPWLSADIGARVGVYTDFEHTSSDSIRVMGRGLGVLTFSPTLRVALGAIYLDRVDVKFLPAGGFIWTPDEDTRYDILFPNPKLARRWTTIGTTEWWYYFAGEYGLGSWTIDRTDGSGDQVDVNDIRIIAGLEWFALSGTRGVFEVGYVFDRKLVYKSGQELSLDDTVMLRAGVAY